MSNCLGNKLRLTVFGQSHAPAIGCVVEGLPAGIAFDWDRVNAFMRRRAPGRGEVSTSRREDDVPQIVSGLNEAGETCGAPLTALIYNRDQRGGDYAALRARPRPGHADYAAYVKYAGHNDIRGGGQFSGRLTAPVCFAGALCLQLLDRVGVFVAARAFAIAGIHDAPMDATRVDRDAFIAAASREIPATDPDAAEEMRRAILSAKEAGDSVGGVVESVACGLPAGLGDPMFEGVENRLAQAVFGIPAVRGVEFGEGFAAAAMRGSEHNDAFVRDAQGRVVTPTNHHAGILGGVTTGMPIVMRAAFKPTPSIAVPQRTVDLMDGGEAEISVPGRHDPCVVPRAVPVVEAVMAFVLTDILMEERPREWN